MCVMEQGKQHNPLLIKPQRIYTTTGFIVIICAIQLKLFVSKDYTIFCDIDKYFTYFCRYYIDLKRNTVQ